MSAKTKAAAGQYNAEQITVLEGLDPVRKRPGMYIGSTGPEGLHHLVWEVIDNSIDEAMAGFCTEIIIELRPDSHIAVTDNGRGIPVDIHKQTKVSALETVLTKLHAGGKFGGDGYKVSGGLHGVGVSVVNALSDYMRAEVKRDGKLWMQEYSCGKPRAKVKSVGSAKGNGTTIIFHPDKTIFTTLEFQWQTIIDHLRQQGRSEALGDRAQLEERVLVRLLPALLADVAESEVMFLPIAVQDADGDAHRPPLLEVLAGHGGQFVLQASVRLGGNRTGRPVRKEQASGKQ